jgi:hypothetical protein
MKSERTQTLRFLSSAACLAALVLHVALSSASAEQLRFSLTDPVGQEGGQLPLGRVDLVGMEFTFDNTTGSYSIRFTAAPANPFQQGFRLNLSLFNPDTGGSSPDPSFFSSTNNDFSFATPSLTAELSGVSLRLLAWQAGDRVAPSGPVPLGVPDGTVGFHSGVLDLPLDGMLDLLADGQFTTIEAVPEPSLTVLLGLGALAVFLRRRKA